MNKPLLIGYHTNIDRYFENEPTFDTPAKTGRGVDFILCHYDPSGLSIDEECERVKKSAEAVKALGADVIFNFEKQNFVYSDISSDGFDWANHPDGTHRLELPEKFVRAMNECENFIGVMYDELEHVIINRNLSIYMNKKFRKGTDYPVFPLSESRDPVVQGELLSSQIKEYTDDLLNKGAKTVSGEHVMPVLFHTFAKNGIIPNFKSQKESYSNVQYAVAAGAALQYGTPLFNCIDLWNSLTFPGHSPEEMSANLKFAYLTGVDRVYVESSQVFMDGEKKELNEYGRKFCEFCDEYKGKERDYNVLDFKPEIGIIRYEDTYWGQGRTKHMWRYMLFGNPAIRPDKKAKEWIKAFDIITHGETGGGGIYMGRIELRSLRRHRSFASMNNAAVFDDNADESVLSSLKLCFLCGYRISEKTLGTVSKLVHDNGLTAVTSERFLPDDKKGQTKRFGITCIEDGKGEWIVTKSFSSRKLKKKVGKFLGNKGEMAYRFGEKLLKMKITDDGDTFELL